MAFRPCDVTWYGASGAVEDMCAECCRPRSEHLRSLRDEESDVGTDVLDFIGGVGLCPGEVRREFEALIKRRRR